jgi:hypothetical protein
MDAPLWGLPGKSVARKMIGSAALNAHRETLDYPRI